MVSSEVQRTLVKSPPELWAELSDPAALARHLSELGEIRITRVDPEQRVEWEAENTTGSVSLKASGWGTKVTLSVTRAPDAGTATATASEPVDSVASQAPPAADSAVEPVEPVETGASQGTPATEPVAGLLGAPAPEAEPPTELQARPLAEPEPPPAPLSEPPAEPVAEAAQTPKPPAQPAPRRGFLARLFRRGEPRSGAPEVTVGAVPDAPSAVAVRQSTTPSQIVVPEEIAELLVNAVRAQGRARRPAPVPARAEPAAATATSEPGLAAELRAAEEATEERVTAVLTAVLDRLGAAHHRPFSRA